MRSPAEPGWRWRLWRFRVGRNARAVLSGTVVAPFARDMAPSGRWLRRLPWQEPAAPSMRRQPGRPCCTRLDAYLAPQVRPLARAAHGPGISLPGCGQDGLGPARGLGGTAAECEVRGLHADPRRLGLWHAEPFEDIQRLPEGDPRRVRPLRAERRFRDSLEDFALLVRVTDLPG